jgi:hypothetical protein
VRRGHLFREITRYSKNEDRLTAILAAVLWRVPELGLKLARAWTHPESVRQAPGERASETTGAVWRALEGLELRSVRTQVPTKDGTRRTVDLALHFGRSDARREDEDDVLLWVEIKHGTDPSDQIHWYWDHLREQHPRYKAVVLLAPRTSLPYDDGTVPCQVPQRSWQATGRIVRDIADCYSAKVDDGTYAVRTFLLEELHSYMQEESLIEPQAVGPEHLLALAYAVEAENALVGICERVSASLKRWLRREPDDFQRRSYTRKPDYGWGYYETWNLPDETDGKGPWLDWNAKRGHPEAAGRSLVFISGLTAPDHDSLPLTAQDQERIGSGQFQRVSDEVERLCRVAFPEEVLVGRTLDQQAKSLADWIYTGFEDLERVDDVTGNGG